MIDSGDYVLVDVRPREMYDSATPAGAKNAPLFQRVDWSKPSFGKFLRAGALMANGVTPVRRAPLTSRVPVPRGQTVKGNPCTPALFLFRHVMLGIWLLGSGDLVCLDDQHIGRRHA